MRPEPIRYQDPVAAARETYQRLHPPRPLMPGELMSDPPVPSFVFEEIAREVLAAADGIARTDHLVHEWRRLPPGALDSIRADLRRRFAVYVIEEGMIWVTPPQCMTLYGGRFVSIDIGRPQAVDSEPRGDRRHGWIDPDDMGTGWEPFPELTAMLIRYWAYTRRVPEADRQ